jgi:ATP adenylyltransferase
MDYLWTPWRYSYITGADKATGCIFCEKAQESDDRKNLIVHRAKHCFIILNAFPYTSGHVMVVPYEHVDQLTRLPADAAAEMMSLAQRMETVLREIYSPDGLNVGMNIGKSAGAGIAAHVHMHILPRWIGDTSFMTTVGETRVLPETLEVTYERIRQKLG